MSPADFWDRTPLQIQYLWDAYAEHRREQWRPFALLSCLYANSHRDPDKRSEPFEIEDFLPLDPNKTSHNEYVQTTEQQTFMLRTWAASFPGVKVVKRDGATTDGA